MSGLRLRVVIVWAAVVRVVLRWYKYITVATRMARFGSIEQYVPGSDFEVYVERLEQFLPQTMSRW